MQALSITLTNLRALPARWGSAVVVVIGVAGVVGVLTAMLAMAVGFERTLKSAGAPDRAIVMRDGSTSELSSGINQEVVNIAESVPGVMRDAEGRALISPEVFVVSDVPKIGSGTDVPIVHTVELLDWATGGPKPRALKDLASD